MAPRKKTTPAADVEVTTKITAVDTDVKAEAAEKKTPSRKTAAKQTTTAKKASTTTKKTTRTTKKAETAPVVEDTIVETPTVEAPATEAPATEAPAAKAEVFIEYGGVQVSVDDIIRNAKLIVGDNKDIKIYVQPNTSKAYIAFGEETVSMDVFFC